MSILGNAVCILSVAGCAYLYGKLLSRWFGRVGINYFLPYLLALMLGIFSIIIGGMILILKCEGLLKYVEFR